MKKQVAYLQKLFYDIWNDFGTVYLLVGHSDRTQIGKRGFTDDEKQRGLILVFNNKTNTDVHWDDEGNVSCILAFGARKEDVRIHHDDLRGVFSPEAQVQLMRSDMDTAPADKADPETPRVAEDKVKEAVDPHVVSMDSFRKRKKE